MFLKIQNIRLKSGVQTVAISIVKSERCPVTGESMQQFIIHCGTYRVGLANTLRGRLAIQRSIRHACLKAGLNLAERRSVLDSEKRNITGQRFREPTFTP